MYGKWRILPILVPINCIFDLKLVSYVPKSTKSTNSCSYQSSFWGLFGLQKVFPLFKKSFPPYSSFKESPCPPLFHKSTNVHGPFSTSKKVKIPLDFKGSLVFGSFLFPRKSLPPFKDLNKSFPPFRKIENSTFPPFKKPKKYSSSSYVLRNGGGAKFMGYPDRNLEDGEGADTFLGFEKRGNILISAS